MKQIKFLAVTMLIACMSIFTSCSDDDSTVDYSDIIVGRWVSGSTSVQASLYGITIPGTQLTTESTNGNIWEFTSDHKFYISGVLTGTYSISGYQLILFYTDETTANFTVSINEDTMSLSSKIADSSILSMLGISLDSSWFSLLGDGAQISTSMNMTRSE